MSSKLVCRHCKGDHLSLKCPEKNKNNSKPKIVLDLKKPVKKMDKPLITLMYPLPLDMNKYELLELLREWGPIGKVFLKKDYRNKCLKATIEFKKKSQGLKAIYQLNDTPFDYMKIKLEEITTKNYF